MRTTSLTAIVVLALAAHAPVLAADVQAGKTKASGCAGCHGANGEGAGGNPALAGMPVDRFVQAMKDYKSGKRPNAMMKTLAAQLSDGEVANLAAYYASLKAK